MRGEESKRERRGSNILYTSTRMQVHREEAMRFYWGQCLGKDSLRRGHFSGVWMGEQCVDRQRSKGKGIPGKARTPSSWYLATACSVFLEQGACVFGGHGARRES